MKVVERINEILKEKNLSKKELAHRLIDLGLRANKTGESPTISSIYAYLNGNIDLKADMLPFIADALGVYEQELFSEDSKRILRKFYLQNPIFAKYSHIVELLEYISPKSLETLERTLTSYKHKTQELNHIIEKI
ncbi:helix-turn-helix domain-containing protein [Helicobacter sp. MIT 21-1697]|uniref:helix-turn-helix domain-containing protein n=1 Tax=Helicobacter sp. MIT 21-1697 TaxID=2993733 RepID=UPI00224AC583|nr:helix-turn-helix domain-containing protein [Helicobacter sp. MIT 21-1697]MCX2716881.1 helix-turn-helix domain-containing protein [Helicobacter sp. MIT 21-1697]